MPASEQSGAQADLSRLLGRTAVAAVAAVEAVVDSRMRLLGVAAPRDPKAAARGEGVALIEVDGVARTVRVGAPVEGGLTLLRVDARSASLGPVGGPASQTLQITPPAPAATGALPPAAPSPVVLGGMPNAGGAPEPGQEAAGPGRNPRGPEGLPLRR
jgi:general secretion pathway protein C